MASLLIIGMGAMGSAILDGILAAKLYDPSEIAVMDHTDDATVAVADRYGVRVGCYKEPTDMVLVCVKPPVVPTVLGQLAAHRQVSCVVSIAAGVSLAAMERVIGTSGALIRVMPNTPVAVGAGMTAIAAGAQASQEDIKQVQAIFQTMGQVVVVTEAQLEALGALSGAGPGYAFVMMDALADAGVRIGLPRALAIQAAAQTFFGAGKMQIESQLHPSVLRDQVTSPGGTTIAGIHAMEKGGLRAALMDGVVACHEKALQMDEKK